jgi:phage-related tail fiber protein
MTNEVIVLLTTLGKQKIQTAVANNTTVNVTSMVYGDSGGFYYVPTESQTSLMHQKGVVSPLDKEYNSDDGFVYFTGTIPANAKSSTIRELGLVDTENALIAIACVPDIEKPLGENGIEISLPISIGFKPSVGSVLTVYVALGDAYPTVTYMKNYINDISIIDGGTFIGST